MVRHALPKDSRAAHHERGGVGDWLGSLVAAGCVVRHAPPKDSGAAHHERGGGDGGGAPRTAWVGWVLGGVWFDTPRRETLGRLTTNGVGDGMGAPRIAWVGWVVEVCGSLRQAQGRLSGTRVGTPRTGGDRPTASEAWVLGAVWFDTALRGLRAGSPRTGWGGD